VARRKKILRILSTEGVQKSLVGWLERSGLPFPSLPFPSLPFPSLPFQGSKLAESKMFRLVSIVFFLAFMAFSLSAQVHLGANAYATKEMVNSSAQPTNNEAQLDDTGDILVGNSFGVAIILEVRDADGVLMFSTSVPAENIALGTHNIPPGLHDVRVCEAGNPPPVKCGTVCVP